MGMLFTPKVASKSPLSMKDFRLDDTRNLIMAMISEPKARVPIDDELKPDFSRINQLN